MIEKIKKYSPMIALISVLVAVFSIGLNVVQSVKSDVQNKIMRKFAYENRVMLHKPEISIVGQPIVNRVKFIKENHVLEKTSMSSIVDTVEPFQIYSSVEINFDVKLTNKSKNTANMIMWSYYDTLSYNRIIQKKLFSIIDNMKRENLDTNHISLKLNENDTVTFSYNHLLGTPTTYEPVDECILHLYYLFQNEVGDLYSYYYMVRYKIMFPEFKVRFKNIPNAKNLKKIEITDMEYFCKNCLTYIKSTDYLDFYSEEEGNAIIQKLDLKEKKFDYEDEIAKKMLKQ